jgi:hypothetical protein
MATAAGNDFSPCLRVAFEALSLERIDLITDEANNFHLAFPPGGPGEEG